MTVRWSGSCSASRVHRSASTGCRRPRRSSRPSSCNRGTGCCSTRMGWSRGDGEGGRGSASTASPTSSGAPMPKGWAVRRPSAASATACWSTPPSSCTTTPRCCWSNGGACPRARPVDATAHEALDRHARRGRPTACHRHGSSDGDDQDRPMSVLDEMAVPIVQAPMAGGPSSPAAGRGGRERRRPRVPRRRLPRRRRGWPPTSPPCGRPSTGRSGSTCSSATRPPLPGPRSTPTPAEIAIEAARVGDRGGRAALRRRRLRRQGRAAVRRPGGGGVVHVRAAAGRGRPADSRPPGPRSGSR